GIAEAFLIPYNEKLYACDLASLDPDSMGRFFPKANIDDIIKNFKESNSNSYNDIFSYPKGGAIEYINSLLINIEKANIRYNESLVKIDPENKIAYTNNTEIKFEYLISSAPFPSLLNFLNIKADSTVFSSNKVLVFNLGFDKKGDAKNHWIYFPEKETRFYRIGYYDNIIHQDRMSLYVEIGMKTDETVDPEKELERVLQDLKKAQIITDQNLIASHHVVMNPAYVHITKGSQELFEKYSNELSSKNIYSIGRYGGWKYCSIEDNIIEAKALASSLQQKLN
ncbi:MAG: protoporphyrinogen/coproporphyrinogen oxidase, partial [Bacteroidia bacterium]